MSSSLSRAVARGFAAVRAALLAPVGAVAAERPPASYAPRRRGQLLLLAATLLAALSYPPEDAAPRRIPALCIDAESRGAGPALFATTAPPGARAGC